MPIYSVRGDLYVILLVLRLTSPHVLLTGCIVRAVPVRSRYGVMSTYTSHLTFTYIYFAFSTYSHLFLAVMLPSSGFVSVVHSLCGVLLLPVSRRGARFGTLVSVWGGRTIESLGQCCIGVDVRRGRLIS